LQTKALELSEPHPNSVLCIVCKRGDQIVDPKTMKVHIGQVMAIVGASGTGKTMLVKKLAD